MRERLWLCSWPNVVAIWLLVVHSVLGHGALVASCRSSIGRWDLLTPSLIDVEVKCFSSLGGKVTLDCGIHDLSALQSYSLPGWAKGTVNLELIFLPH